ncbi:holo-[acyl-carrier-protein] synthase [Colwellia chukchiensis]|uniref:Holo-[acyl-carrier-protein] synthase n=1 Tax=Colwellia chukchiensis TaxID=641665 RepID=A0A1H7JCQ3_9GAMM|nr:holo-ACP synthase [Colwellia chukchiensis]SEK72388.1 holo-[acyl-carrier-protein] synthase [Colwellia chukchiensis]
MSVVGIGTDIVDIRRIAKMSDNAQLRLAKRILTPNEQQYYFTLKQPERFLAKRWAGKEAMAKAIGTGIASGVSFQHIEIVSLASGQPTLVLSLQALALATGLGANTWHISLSDEKNYATAFVVLSQ